LGLL
jgi:hypothetical protein